MIDELVSDIAEFFGVDEEEAREAIEAAIRGNGPPIGVTSSDVAEIRRQVDDFMAEFSA